jgi:hypothetical protein
MVGITLFGVWGLFEMGCYWVQNPISTLKTRLFDRWLGMRAAEGAVILAVCLGTCSVLWPYLSTKFFQHFVNVFWFSENFPPHFDFLFLGHLVSSLDYPWYTLPLWILVSVPLFILVLSGMVWIGPRRQDPLTLLATIALVVNLAAFLILKPAIYDGLRHALFLLPMLSLLAAIGFVKWVKRDQKLWVRGLWGGALGFNVLLVIVHLVRLHPYEYVYFNELAGGEKGAYGNFETDYWGASLKESVEWVKTHEATDLGRVYKVFAEGNPFQSILFFGPNMKPYARSEADYVILINRAGGKPTPAEESKVIHVVEREGVPLSFILKMK